jgi:hypothetical protein
MNSRGSIISASSDNRHDRLGLLLACPPFISLSIIIGLESPMKLDLSPKEAKILKEVLSHYLSDLRMEVSNTERYELRQTMKGQEDTIGSIIERLKQHATTSS